MPLADMVYYLKNELPIVIDYSTGVYDIAEKIIVVVYTIHLP
jgi:hypothetical protein